MSKFWFFQKKVKILNKKNNLVFEILVPYTKKYQEQI